jgi:amino acid adenylation domain-containing protein
MPNTANPLRGITRDRSLVARLHDGTSGELVTSAAEPVPAWCATPGQEQVWFFDTMTPGTAVSNLPLLVDVDGPVDLTAVRRAVNLIVARHEPLRTAFVSFEDSVLPVPAARPYEPVVVHDLATVPPDEREAAERRLVAEVAREPFDLAEGPLWRMAVIRRSDVSHLLVIVTHHIVSDGYSMVVLRQELIEVYRSLLAGRAPDLAPVPVTYQEFARWQRDRLAGAPARADLEYWREALRDLPGPVEWPYAQGGREHSRYDAETVEVTIDAELSAGIRRFASTERCSPQMVLLAGLAGLIHRVTGGTDVLIGTPTAGRPPHVGDGVIGYFVNMLALRLPIGADPTGRSLLHSARDASLDGLAHQGTPFLDVVRVLQPERRPGVHPIYQIIFTSPPPLDSCTVGATTFGFAEAGSGDSLYDIELQLPETAGARHGFLKYRTALFDREQAQALVDGYLRLLTCLIASPDRPVAGYPLLNERVRDRVVREWNSTATGYPRDSSLPELFEEQVDATPDAIALDYAGTRLTYRELDRRANQLAHHLAAHGVGVEDRVGLCVDRSSDWMLCALAVIKLGAAYVPLDPEYPLDSLAHMVAACGATVLVAQRRSRDRVPSGATVLVLDDEWAAVEGRPTSRPGTRIHPDGLAYVMFTSGSTGRPKGVAVTNRNVVRLVRGTDYVSLRPGDTMAQASNISFDAATFEVWGALLNGGRLVGVSKADLLDPVRLGERLREQHVDTMFLTTSLAMQLARLAPETLGCLRQFIFGGELPDAYAIGNLLAHDPPERVLNAYGPTETTTFASTLPCVGPIEPGARVPIGRPIANTRIYVLDDRGEPVAPGVAGELYIGGDGLARGYWNEPALTASRFVPDRLSGEPGARLYRTGDLGRFRTDGAIEYLGRIDRQVKIRGFRVEPGEVEDCLHRSGLVRHAAVRPWRDPDGDVTLVGYLVLADPDRGEAAVHEYLRGALPAHLVPTVLVAVSELPLTANGKLDEQALPPPRRSTGTADSAETETERQVAAAWQELLGVPAIGRHDNFFELGGHSLRVTRAVARIAEQRGVDIPLVTLFEHPTVAGFAAAVDELRAAAADVLRTAAAPADDGTGGIAELLDEVSRLSAADLALLAGAERGEPGE